MKSYIMENSVSYGLERRTLVSIWMLNMYMEWLILIGKKYVWTLLYKVSTALSEPWKVELVQTLSIYLSLEEF